jgi:thiol-disulfide isomerase/thioredoxin
METYSAEIWFDRDKLSMPLDFYKRIFMKRLISRFHLAITLCLVLICDLSNAAEVSPKLSIETMSGTQFDLSAKGTQPLYIKFWATWCQDCIAQMPHLERTYRQYQGRVRVIAINLGMNDDEESVKKVIKHYGLTVPIAIDKNGDLAQKFNLVATPMHLVFDGHGKLVYKGYLDTKPVDRVLQQVTSSQREQLTAIKPESSIPEKSEASGLQHTSPRYRAVYYFATWCESYLKDSRPEQSKRCIDTQNAVSKLSNAYSGIQVVGIASRLWTKDADLIAYKDKFHIRYPIEIDHSNNQFFNEHVRSFPAIILYKDDVEIYRSYSFDLYTIVSQLKSHGFRSIDS